MIDHIFRKSTGKFAESEVDGELVLMNIDTGHFHALKGTGLAIWRLVDGKRTLAAIQAELQRDYDVDEARCRSESAQFLASLKAAGFVELA